jgi:pimeloyl-ACP methyl ester carboxylesterase
VSANAELGWRGWVVRGDVRLRVQVAGQGPGLVLLHGWAMDHRVFQLQVRAFAGRFKVVAFDRRGFGSSSGPPDLNREVDDLDAVARELLGDQPFHLLGMSQGGRIALRFAVAQPHRLRALILQGAAVDGVEPEGPEAQRIPMDLFAHLARAGQLDEVRRLWLEHPLMDIDGSAAGVRGLVVEMLADYRGTDLLTDRAMEPGAVDVLGALGSLAIPVLMLTGTRETQARRRLARRLVAQLPDAREIVFGNSGHLCNLTEPQAYNDAVIAFCNSADVRCRASGTGPEN